MDLNNLYEDIMKRGQESILQGNEYVDLTINDCQDTRMGITLVIRPTQYIQDKVCDVITKLKKIEPEQYYYPREDFHLTLFDIITARQSFHYSEEQKLNCMALADAVLKNFSPFQIEFKGLTMSESCVMVKGFCDEKIQEIRTQFRTQIEGYGLKLDERYPTKSSHITISRFRKSITNGEKFVKTVQSLSQTEFGVMEVKNVELIYHNWFDSIKELIQNYSLK